MKNFKRIFALCVVLSTLALVMVLTSCNVTGLVSNNVESMMDDVMTGDNYTVEYKSESDIYYTLKVADGELYYSVKSEAALDEYYLFKNDETGKYYHAHQWKYGEKDKGEEKSELTKNEYIVRYMAVYSQYSRSSQAFNYRHILEMAENVGDDKYEFSKEVYGENQFSVTEYTIQIKNDSLIFLAEHTETLEDDENDAEDGDSIKIITERTTYSAIGETEISVPNKILNMK